MLLCSGRCPQWCNVVEKLKLYGTAHLLLHNVRRRVWRNHSPDVSLACLDWNVDFYQPCPSHQQNVICRNIFWFQVFISTRVRSSVFFVSWCLWIAIRYERDRMRKHFFACLVNILNMHEVFTGSSIQCIAFFAPGRTRSRSPGTSTPYETLTRKCIQQSSLARKRRTEIEISVDLSESFSSVEYSNLRLLVHERRLLVDFSRVSEHCAKFNYITYACAKRNASTCRT